MAQVQIWYYTGYGFALNDPYYHTMSLQESMFPLLNALGDMFDVSFDEATYLDHTYISSIKNGIRIVLTETSPTKFLLSVAVGKEHMDNVEIPKGMSQADWTAAMDAIESVLDEM